MGPRAAGSGRGLPHGRRPGLRGGEPAGARSGVHRAAGPHRGAERGRPVASCRPGTGRVPRGGGAAGNCARAHPRRHCCRGEHGLGGSRADRHQLPGPRSGNPE
ncbi:hypothetical protein B6R96_25755 [Streptomyces sp. Sge12]|nr:hypothetical protein B6R96_25755 [Streptomyces sp. Sge12]